jgi:hypothetical protein
MAAETPAADESIERCFDPTERRLFRASEPPSSNAADGVRGRGVQRYVMLKFASKFINRGVGGRLVH